MSSKQIEIHVFLLFGSVHQVRRPLLGLRGEHPLLLKLKTAAGLLFYKCHIVPPSFLVHNWATPGFLVLINSFGERSKLGLFMWGSQVWRRVSWRVFSLEWTLSSRVAALFSLQRIEARIHSVLRFTATSVSTCQHQKTHLGNQSSQFPLDHWSYWDESLKCAVKWYSLFTLIENPVIFPVEHREELLKDAIVWY